MLKRALYAGSFDPITRGHIDIVEKALATFDVVQIAVANNAKKTRLFSNDEAKDVVKQALHEHFIKDRPGMLARIEVSNFTGSLAKHAREASCDFLVRGLRQISDFDSEFTIHGAIENIAPDLTMVHFISDTKYLHVSSSMARELGSLGEPLGWLLTPYVEETLMKRIRERA
jgi:pantetheine-phosphate adenylyltransferase